MHSERNTHIPYKVIDLTKLTATKSDSYEVLLNWYEKKGKNLIGEEPVNNLAVDDVLKLFDAPFWNKIYQCWAINPEQIDYIQPNVNHKFNTDKFAYFMVIYKVN